MKKKLSLIYIFFILLKHCLNNSFNKSNKNSTYGIEIIKSNFLNIVKNTNEENKSNNNIKENYLFNLKNFEDNDSTIINHKYTNTSKKHFTYTEFCEEDKDCNSLNYCINKECYHAGIFPLSFRELLGITCLIIGLVFSTAVGMGGGGITLPILILILNFYSHQAIPLSKAIIFSNSLIGLIMHITQRHPNKKSITIEYNLIMLAVPNLLLGTTVGVNLNNIINGTLLLIVLSIFLLLTTFKMIKNTIIFINKEQNVTTESKKLVINEEMKDKSNYTSNNDTNYISDRLKSQEKEDNNIFPVRKIFLIALSYATFLVFILINLSKFGKNHFGLDKCKFNYWIVYALFSFILLCICYISSKNLLYQHKLRIDIGYNFIESDLNWNSSLIFKIIVISFLIGILSGAVGLGGGALLSPFFLELGINPIVATHTSNFLVVFTSSSTIIQFYLLDMIVLDYAVIVWVLPILSAIVGVLSINYIIKKTNKEYPLFIIASIVLLFASIGMISYICFKISYTENISDLLLINKFCN